MINKKILWQGPAFSGSGYGKVSRDYIKLFNKYNYDIKLNNIEYDNFDNKSYVTEEDYSFLNSVKCNVKTIDINRVFINHVSPDIAVPDRNFEKSVCYSMWETDRVSEIAANRVNEFDALFTGSEFSKQAFINGGVNIPIKVIPHVVEENIVDIDNETLIKLRNNFKHIFLSVFEWHLGKGYDILLKGFIETFKDNKDVILILKTNSFVKKDNYLKEEVLNYIKEIKGKNEYPKIFPIIGAKSENFMNQLHSVCDTFISTSRREGFNLGAAQALVNGKKVIAFNKGGHREFLDGKNSFLVKSEMVDIEDELLERERKNYLGQKWVAPDYKDFKNKLATTLSGDFVVNKENIKQKLSKQNIIQLYNTYLGEL